MLFDTPIYLLFLSIVVLIYWWLPRRPQNIFLLAASYFFYGWWDWRFLGLILLSTLVDFYCARVITSSNDRNQRRLLLILSVSMNLGFLGYFKYCDFFIDSFASAGQPAPRAFPARWTVLRLDRIYARNVQVQGARVLSTRPWSHLSDHAPLCAEIRL